MPILPCCVDCGKEYKVKQTGIGVLEHLENSHAYRVSAADLLECPRCGHEITWGYGEAIHHSAEPKKAAADITYYQKHTKLVKVF